jgi:hypothetical protein
VVGRAEKLLERMHESDPMREDLLKMIRAGHEAARLTRVLAARLAPGRSRFAGLIGELTERYGFSEAGPTPSAVGMRLRALRGADGQDREHPCSHGDYLNAIRSPGAKSNERFLDLVPGISHVPQPANGVLVKTTLQQQGVA